MKPAVRIPGVPADVQTGPLPNTNLEPYRSVNQLGAVCIEYMYLIQYRACPISYLYNTHNKLTTTRRRVARFVLRHN
jgi:hypothetical protein